MSPIKVLIVIDNVLTRKMVRSVLSGGGYEVVEARDGQTAIEMVREHAPRIILQDLTLPDADGRQLLHRIRTLPGGESISILAYAATARQEEEAGACHAGFDGYVDRRTEPARLLGVLRLYAGRGQRIGCNT